MDRRAGLPMTAAFVVSYKSMGNSARAACMPCGLYVLLALICSVFKNKPLTKENSGSTNGPILTKFSPYARYLIVDCRLGPLFRWLKGCCHGNKF